MEKINIINFAVLTENEKNKLQSIGNVKNFGTAIGQEADPTEDDMINILSKEEFEVLIVNSAPVTKKVIDILKNTKLIICARGNPVNVDVEYCKNKSIIVTHTPGRNANAVAEYTISMIISSMRNIPDSILALKNKECTLDLPLDKVDRNKKDVAWMHPSLKYEPYAALANAIRFARDLFNEPESLYQTEQYFFEIKRLEYLNLYFKDLGDGLVMLEWKDENLSAEPLIFVAQNRKAAAVGAGLMKAIALQKMPLSMRAYLKIEGELDDFLIPNPIFIKQNLSTDLEAAAELRKLYEHIRGVL